MPRDGTRSQTGNSKPRVFAPVDTAPVIKRAAAKVKAKVSSKPTTTTTTKTAKPVGVTKTKPAVKPKVRASPLLPSKTTD